MARLRRALAGCRCPVPGTGGSCWGWTSARGCARTPRPARGGCSAIHGRGQGQRADDPRLAVLVRGRAGDPAAPPGPRCPGRGPARPGRRRHRSDRDPSARGGRPAARGRAAGHAGDPDILVVFDAGYDVCRLAFLFGRSARQVLGRIRSDRVLCALPQPPRPPGPRRAPAATRPAFALARAGDGPPRRHDQHRHQPLRHAPAPRPGTGSTPAWNTAAPGSTTTVISPSWRAP